jgi:protein-S-isoprenylcysteine O-methyltransferase Ste14
MGRISEILVRLRVPLGWALGLVALLLARPNIASLAAGLAIAALGEGLRVWAAGHLNKWKGLTRSGPYAWTRNPLYVGSFLIGVGFSVATARWEIGLLLVAFFVGVYLPVMKAEAARLAEQYPAAYPGYAHQVPLVIPWPRRGESAAQEGSFSWKKVVENREHVTVAGWLAGALLLWWRMF